MQNISSNTVQGKYIQILFKENTFKYYSRKKHSNTILIGDRKMRLSWYVAIRLSWFYFTYLLNSYKIWKSTKFGDDGNVLFNSVRVFVIAWMQY